MINQFDSANYPEGIPAELVAGARWAWKNSAIQAVYPKALYTLEYRLDYLDDQRGKVNSITAGDSQTVEVSQATTGGYQPGEYQYQVVIIRDSDSEPVVIDAGHLTVASDFGEGTGDARSWVYRVLMNVRRAIEGTASKEQLRYSVAGRTLERRSIDELMKLEREFAERWANEKAAADRKAGRKARRRVLVTMGGG